MAALLIKSSITVTTLEHIAARGHMWAVVDACDEPSVPPRCEQLGDRAISLYRGRAQTEYADIAPYLVLLDKPTIDWISSELWTRPWGIFIYSEAARDPLRTHLRRFLKVRAPDRKPHFFRYYDPEILRAFLESCTRDELEQFFGPIKAYGVSAASEITFYRRSETMPL